LVNRLLLVPTELERQKLRKKLSSEVSQAFQCELCGFGPIAAAASTSLLISRLQPKLVVLAGIAGTYDENRAAVGSAAVIRRIHCDGVGVGQEPNLLSPKDVGFPQWAGTEPSKSSARSNIFNSLDLGVEAIANQVECELLTAVSVCAASADSRQVAVRRERYPSDVLLEDMETFAVALACALTNTPLVAFRGISNVAGNRDVANWKIDDAIESVVKGLARIVDQETKFSAPIATAD
jgi:futalosine hydrolase